MLFLQLTRFRRQTRSLAVLSLLLALTGCGGPRTAEVSGKVMYKGELVPTGKIAFIAEDGRMDWSSISNGEYTMSRAPVGPVRVTVEGGTLQIIQGPPMMRKVPEGMMQMKGDKPGPIDLPDPTKEKMKVPPKYGDEKNSGLTYEVQSGKQEKDFDLPP
jgi:hypothetical protein